MRKGALANQLWLRRRSRRRQREPRNRSSHQMRTRTHMKTKIIQANNPFESLVFRSQIQIEGDWLCIRILIQIRISTRIWFRFRLVRFHFRASRCRSSRCYLFVCLRALSLASERESVRLSSECVRSCNADTGKNNITMAMRLAKRSLCSLTQSLARSFPLIMAQMKRRYTNRH